jgi:hypothetical protein
MTRRPPIDAAALAWLRFTAGAFDQQVADLYRGDMTPDAFRLATGCDPVAALLYVKAWLDEHGQSAGVDGG